MNPQSRWNIYDNTFTVKILNADTVKTKVLIVEQNETPHFELPEPLFTYFLVESFFVLIAVFMAFMFLKQFKRIVDILVDKL